MNEWSIPAEEVHRRREHRDLARHRARLLRDRGATVREIANDPVFRFHHDEGWYHADLFTKNARSVAAQIMRERGIHYAHSTYGIKEESVDDDAATSSRRWARIGEQELWNHPLRRIEVLKSHLPLIDAHLNNLPMPDGQAVEVRYHLAKLIQAVAAVLRDGTTPE